MTIGDRIKIRREELQMSQNELAEKIGYKSRSSINKIELNLYNLNQSKIKAIADALLTTPSYIMGWDEIDTSQIKQQKNNLELIEVSYGKSVKDALDLYIRLDQDDQGEIRGEMKQMLKAEKYSTKESKHA